MALWIPDRKLVLQIAILHYHSDFGNCLGIYNQVSTQYDNHVNTIFVYYERQW